MPLDVSAAIDDVNRAFEEFKSEFSGKLDDVGGKLDALDRDKYEKLEQGIDKLQAQIDADLAERAAKELGGGESSEDEVSAADREWSRVFEKYIRQGDIGNKAEISAMHLEYIGADIQKTLPQNGGYFAPTEWDRKLRAEKQRLSPLRRVFSVQDVGPTGSFSTLWEGNEWDAYFADELDERPTTDHGTLAEMEFGVHELIAKPRVTRIMLEDSLFDLTSWIRRSVARRFTQRENDAFINGDGVKRARGFLEYASDGLHASVHPSGSSVADVLSGDETALTSVGVLDIAHDLDEEYDYNASWIMNRKTVGACRKLQDGTGAFHWAPSLAQGQPQKLLDYPITTVAEMPDVEAGARPIAFGDFKEAYAIFDRLPGMSIFVNPFADDRFIVYTCRERFGGALLDPFAARFMRIGVQGS